MYDHNADTLAATALPALLPSTRSRPLRSSSVDAELRDASARHDALLQDKVQHLHEQNEHVRPAVLPPLSRAWTVPCSRGPHILPNLPPEQADDDLALDAGQARARDARAQAQGDRGARRDQVSLVRTSELADGPLARSPLVSAMNRAVIETSSACRKSTVAAQQAELSDLEARLRKADEVERLLRAKLGERV